VLVEELGYSGCPGWDVFGVGMLAPTLLNLGSEEHRERFLSGIAKGETFFLYQFVGSELKQSFPGFLMV